MHIMISSWKNGGDSGHRPGKSNIVRAWKQENGLEYYVLRLSTVSYISKIAGNRLSKIFTNIPTGMIIPKKNLIYEGWAHVSQDFINEKVASTPESLEAVICSWKAEWLTHREVVAFVGGALGTGRWVCIIVCFKPSRHRKVDRRDGQEIRTYLLHALVSATSEACALARENSYICTTYIYTEFKRWRSNLCHRA